MAQLKGACIIGQSGGPTAVINASCYGAIKTALENENITAEVYDINHFPALKDQYNVMSVPCLVINDGEKISFGKKNAAQVLELLK